MVLRAYGSASLPTLEMFARSLPYEKMLFEILKASVNTKLAVADG